jgi:hypothetical protein
MADFPEAATIFSTSPSWTAAQAVTEFTKWLASTVQLPGASPAESLTISSGAVSPTKSLIVLDTEGAAAADDLTTINLTNLHTGAVVLLTQANSGRVVTVKNGGSTNNIVTLTGTDYVLDPGHWLMLRRDGTLWREIAMSTNKAAIEARLTGLITTHTHNPLCFVNQIINGKFDFWQRGTTQTTSGYGGADRWRNEHSGSTKTHSRQAFAEGQTAVPGNPAYYARTVVTAGGGTGDYVSMEQRIEDVRLLGGKTMMLSFYAKADAVKNLGIEVSQNFGSGGSATLNAIGATKVALTASWARYTVAIPITSLSGKTVGTFPNFTAIRFWFDAGSTLNTRTATLGHQSGTFDIAMVQLEDGAYATPFEQRPIGVENDLVSRFYEKSVAAASCYASAAGQSLMGTCNVMSAKPNMANATVTYSNSYVTTDLNIDDATYTPDVYKMQNTVVIRRYSAAAGAASSSQLVTIDAEI